jgi:protocadherin-16/23
LHYSSTSGGCLTRSEFSEKSSGRGSVEDEEDADVEIRMINEGGYLSPVSGATGLNGPDSSNACSFLNEEDKLSEEGSVQNTEEYLARLGIDIRKPPNIKGLDGAVANAMSDHYSAGSIYNRILDETMSEHSANNKHGGGASSTGGSIYGGVTQRRSHHQPSLTGSLSSVVHSEDELAGSYNWDYLLDWGPQYRPLAHVFKEISQLRDDPQSVGGHVSPATAVAPPPPGNKILPFMTTLKNPTASRLLARPTARSPISHDVLTQSALSPNFHPALSPLATKSPSVSPMSSVPLKRDMNNKISHI